MMWIQTSYKEEFYDENDEELEKESQRGGGCSMLGNLQGQAGQSSEKPDLFEDVPLCCWGLGLDDLKRSFITLTIL